MAENSFIPRNNRFSIERPSILINAQLKVGFWGLIQLPFSKSREKSVQTIHYINIIILSIGIFYMKNERLSLATTRSSSKTATTSDLPSNNNGLYNYIIVHRVIHPRTFSIIHPVSLYPVHKERQLKAR